MMRAESQYKSKAQSHVVSAKAQEQEQRRQFLRLSAGLGLAAGAAALLPTFARAETCTADIELYEALDKAARGEVAAFKPVPDQQKLPDLSFLNETGQETSIAQRAGKTVLLNIWATWCAPCRHEMPDLDALQQELGGDDFEVVAISIDRGTLDKPRAFYEEMQLASLGLYHDPRGKTFNKLRSLGRARGLPFSMLISAKGCELGFMNGPAAWASDDAKGLIRTAIKRS